MPSRRLRIPLLAVVAGLAAATLAAASPASAATPPGAIGFQDQSYTGVKFPPTGSKPESKLWFDHGSWWAVMWQPSGAQYTIWRLDRGTETWVDTGTAVDARNDSRADALVEADGSVTIASHRFVDAGHTASPQPVTPGGGARLYRYAYDGTKYLEPGSFADVEPYETETLVIDRDSTGTLWATWTYGQQAWYAHTTVNDAGWTTPQVVPDTGLLDPDDISSLIAFGGDQMGIMVSNQLTKKVYFAVHPDGASDLQWSTKVVPTGYLADDHISLKADDQGRVYAAVKTSESASSQPLTMLAVRAADGNWTTDVFGTVGDSHTRPIVVLDEQHDLVHLFATAGQSGGDIVEKTTSMDDPSFAAGVGTSVIHDPSVPSLNNATSTKQNVDPSTGLVVLAGNDKTNTYWHLDEPIAPVPLTARFTTTATTGVAPLTVKFTDTSFGAPDARQWSFGDGTTSTARIATHVYASPGTYVVSLTVSSGTTSSSKDATVTVQAATTTPPSGGDGGTPPVTPPPTPVTTPAPTPVPDVIPPGPSFPGTVTKAPSRTAAPKLRGVIQLTGQRVSTVISCSRSGTATLSHLGVKLASVRFTCRSGRGTVRFRLGPKSARRLKATRKPGVVVSVRIGTVTTKLRRDLARGTD